MKQNLQDPILERPPGNSLTLNPLAVQHLDNRLCMLLHYREDTEPLYLIMYFNEILM